MKKSCISTTLLLAAVAILASLANALPATAQPEPLTLRLNDAVGRPGGRTALVFRTYAPRPVGQGQICGDTAFGPVAGEGSLFTALLGAEVISPLEDAGVRARLVDGVGQQNVMATFRSPSRTINSVDGPLAVFFVRIDPGAVPGSVHNLSIGLPQTFMTDPQGDPILIEPVSGELRIVSIADPTPVSAEGDKVAPGETALLSFLTFEPQRLSSGQVAIEYDPSVTVGTPVVRMNPGYGDADFTVDDLTPGLIVVAFTSPGRSLNRIPGSLIEVDVETSPDVPLGTRTPVTLVPELTFLVDSAGDMMSLLVEEGGELEFR
jgi:hypothetical protein